MCVCVCVSLFSELRVSPIVHQVRCRLLLLLCFFWCDRLQREQLSKTTEKVVNTPTVQVSDTIANATDVDALLQSIGETPSLAETSQSSAAAAPPSGSSATATTASSLPPSSAATSRSSQWAVLPNVWSFELQPKPVVTYERMVQTERSGMRSASVQRGDQEGSDSDAHIGTLTVQAGTTAAISATASSQQQEDGEEALASTSSAASAVDRLPALLSGADCEVELAKDQFASFVVRATKTVEKALATRDSLAMVLKDYCVTHTDG
jgi:hypothetical protein